MRYLVTTFPVFIAVLVFFGGTASAVQQYGTVAVDSAGLPISVLPDGGHGATAVNQFTTNGQLDAGLYSLTTLPANENAKLPFNFILPDAGNVASFSATSAVNLLLSDSAGSITITAAGGLTNTGIFTSTGVVRPSPAVALTDAVTLGQVDAGVSGTIPGKASGLAPNSKIACTMFVVYPDGGSIGSGSSWSCGGTIKSGGINADGNVNIGDFVVFSADRLVVGGGVHVYGGNVDFGSSGFVEQVSIVPSANLISVKNSTHTTLVNVEGANAITSTQFTTLGQVKALEQTLFSMYPNTLLVNATVLGGHEIGTLPFTVTAGTGSKSIAAGGTGTADILLTDGASSCTVSIPCNTTGVFRVATTGTCAFASAASIAATVSGITGTCAPLPTVVNIDVLGHY